MERSIAFRIRPFDPADQEMARRLILGGLGEHFGHFDESRNPDLDDIAANYLARGHVFVVAEIGRELAATGALIVEVEDPRQEGDWSARMVRVSVARGCRRHGIGRAVVAHLVGIARQQGLARLWVETNDDWEDAIGFYVGCGFREYARAEGSVYLALDLRGA